MKVRWFIQVTGNNLGPGCPRRKEEGKGNG